MSGCYEWRAGDLLLNLYVQPRAGADGFAGPHGDAIKLRISAPPVDGKANEHLMTFLAKAFGVRRNAVELISGANGRRKRVRVRSPRLLPPEVFPPDRQPPRAL